MIRVFDGTRSFPALAEESAADATFPIGQVVYVDLGECRAIDRLRIVATSTAPSSGGDDEVAAIPHKIELACAPPECAAAPEEGWRVIATLSCPAIDGGSEDAHTFVLPFSPSLTRFVRLAFLTARGADDSHVGIRQLSFPCLDEQPPLSSAHALVTACDDYLEALQQLRDDKASLDACVPILQAAGAKGVAAAAAAATEVMLVSERIAAEVSDLESRMRSLATGVATAARDAREAADRAGPLPSWSRWTD